MMDCRMPVFPGNTCKMDYIWKILEQGVIARAPSEEFNVTAARSNQGTSDNKVSNVGETLVSHVEE